MFRSLEYPIFLWLINPIKSQWFTTASCLNCTAHAAPLVWLGCSDTCGGGHRRSPVAKAVALGISSSPKHQVIKNPWTIQCHSRPSTPHPTISWGLKSESSWLGARRRPRHETVFLLVHCTGATARAHFFLVFFVFRLKWNLFFCLFLLFFFGVVLVGGVGGGGVGGCNNVLWTWAHLGCYVMRSFLGNSTHLGWYVMRSFLGIQHIWDVMSWDLFLEFNTSFSLNFLFFWKHKKGDDATLHEHVSLEVFQWAWRNHALLGKNPSEVLEQLSRLFAD